MINLVAGTILILMFLFFWALVRVGSDADKRQEELMRKQEDDNNVY